MKKITLLLLLFPFIGCIHAQTSSNDLKKLAAYMAGSYTSEAQHLKDTANYYNIHLQIVPIWKNRTDGFWFYVEQAMNGYLDKPYRQRVYHLTGKENNTFESAVFIMNEPLRFTHQAELCEKTLTPDSLKERDGCSVILKKEKNYFTGGTVGNNCPSERKGAKYATAKVTITKNELRSWDQGFDETGKQVWGAEKGGYIFVKKKQ